jgi:RNA polymerase sigma-70 factor, ECF subfamily
MLVAMADEHPRGEEVAAELDARLRAAVASGDVDGATRLAIETYGPELVRFLVSVLRDQTDAAEVFAVVAEAIWRKIGAFTWERTFRVWAFAIARRASLHHRRDAARRRARVEPLSSAPIAAMVEQVRSATLSFLRTERKSRLDAIREELPPEDRALLFLRLDRRLSWNELALALCAESDAPLAEERLKRESARLRKRFQLLKDRLRERAVREGLLASSDER